MENNSSSDNGHDNQSFVEVSQHASPPPETQLPEAILETNLPLPLQSREGSCDIYDLGDYNLAVYTDRAGILGSPIEGGIPQRGLYLARLASYWLQRTAAIIPNHFKALVNTSEELSRFLKEGDSIEIPDNLTGRCIVYNKTKPLDIEFEVWGNLTGPAWKEYQEHETVFGRPQITGLLQSQCIPGYAFVAFQTDACGNRRLLTDEELTEMLGPKLADDINSGFARLYNDVLRTLRVTGKFMVPQMKLVFERDRNKARITNDLLTPDSAYYWDMQTYKIGCRHYSYEEQTLRAWLSHTSWRDSKPLPTIPAEIIAQTIDRHRTLTERITGK
jgi:phosphoribosylaminoimidazole-succinocarboxamide synthase